MRTFLRGKVTLLFLTLGLLLAFSGVALADNFQNTLASSAGNTVTITTDGTTAGTTGPIGFRVIGNSSAGDPQAGCNASDGTPLNVSFSVTNVTASPSSLSFTSCGTTQNVTFSSKTPGNYTIDPGLSDGGAGTYTDQSKFTLVVNDKCPSDDLSGDLQDGKCAAPVTNTAPQVSVTGVSASSYEFGSEPTPGCSVTDTEDGSTASATPVIDRSALNSYGLGNVKVTCSYTDNGGLSDSDEASYTIVDTTAPVIAAHGDENATATSSSGAVVNYTNPTANDAVYGSVSVNCLPASGTTFAVGSTTVTCDATDGSGNQATSTFKVNVAYSASNFLQPINMDGSSIFKQGSTVPVKFQLTGDSAGITDAVANLRITKVNNNVLGDELEAVTSTPASSGSLFRYDATSGQYIYNWGTKSYSAGTYQLRIDLGDGVGTRTVLVSLKK